MTPTHAPSGDPYREHTDSCRGLRMLSFPLRTADSPYGFAGHARYCLDCGAFLPCRDAIEMAAAS